MRRLYRARRGALADQDLQDAAGRLGHAREHAAGMRYIGEARAEIRDDLILRILALPARLRDHARRSARLGAHSGDARRMHNVRLYRRLQRPGLRRDVQKARRGGSVSRYLRPLYRKIPFISGNESYICKR